MLDLERTIDTQIESPADRMIVKLWIDAYEVDEIARFAGLPVERIEAIIQQHDATLNYGNG